MCSQIISQKTCLSQCMPPQCFRPEKASDQQLAQLEMAMLVSAGYRSSSIDSGVERNHGRRGAVTGHIGGIDAGVVGPAIIESNGVRTGAGDPGAC